MYFRNFLYCLPVYVSGTNNVCLLISCDLNNLYHESCFELYGQHLCFILLTANVVNQYHAYFVMISFLCLFIDGDLILQVLASNTRALSLYIWLGLNIVLVVHAGVSTIPYIKIKSIKSKTKNLLRRYLID
uniref:Uncharacterized protein n=1 Tax=Izziella formosana TaxID=1653389 RepID=A0A1G4NUY3_9FLOR|nr:Hypothetical protein ORF_11 [Izziella formosana]SCW22447.1 Hypothetical protein ORF_11 [Izziella formosana]